MSALFALLCALPAQEPSDDLRKEIEKLRAQNRELQERVAQLEESSVQDAEKIQRLRMALKTLETSAPKPPEPTAGPIVRVPGPVNVLKGRVIHVEPKFNFVLIDLGRDRKLQPGYKFEIVRKVYEKDNPDPRLQKLGVAEFEKYIGDAEESSKLKVVEGSAAEMKNEDEAVAIRSLAPPAERKEPPPAERPKNGLYKITAVGGAGRETSFTINYGSEDKARQTDVVFVYKDGAFKTKLRLDSVSKEFSVANLITPVKPELMPEVGDQVMTRELKATLTGKIVLVDDKNGKVAIDIRERDGIARGQKLEVHRDGKKVGTLLVTAVQQWGTWAQPEGETKLDSIRKNDFVQAVEEK